MATDIRDSADSEVDDLRVKARFAVSKTLHFGRRHRSLFVIGALAATLIVGARLALPWPLRNIAKILSEQSTQQLVEQPRQVIVLLALFLILVVVLGLFDYTARLFFSRFSIATTRDLRQAAFVSTLGIDVESRRAATGDIVSRLIGDSGRVKAGLQGFLLHVATNGLLLLGVIAILFTISPPIALVFCGVGLLVGLVTFLGASRIFRRALQHREKEGQLANKIHTSIKNPQRKSTLKRINKRSGKYEASLTRIQGRVAWIAHLIFGLGMVAALSVAVFDLLGSNVNAADTVLLMFYALMLRGPVVRLVRQGTRTGKILGPGYRIAQMLDAPNNSNADQPALRLKKLRKLLALRSVTLVADGGSDQIGPVDIALKKGERVAIVDFDGESLRPLSGALAGVAPPIEGSISWDAIKLRSRNIAALRRQVSLLDVERGSNGTPVAQTAADRLRSIAAFNRRSSSVRVYLEPDAGLNGADASYIIDSLLDPSAESSEALVLATKRSSGLERFDRIVHVVDGRIAFVGQHSDWRSRELRRWNPTKSRSRKLKSKFEVLFTGYAAVHFRCFQPLYERLAKMENVNVTLSGGTRSGDKRNYDYDTAALYDEFDLPNGTVKTVEEIKELEYDVLFSAHTKLILPKHVDRRIQIFHGVSFRNKAVRPENMAYDNYFIVGPYMLSRFTDAGLMKSDDSRIAKIGFMKTDALTNGSLDKQQIQDQYGLDPSKPTVLYAPTGAKKNSLEIMGEDVIKKVVAANMCNLVVKPHDHPKNKDINWFEYLKQYETDHCKVVAPSNDVVPLLFVSDLLISDASSVANEFAMLDRPILFLDTPDLLQQAREASHSMLDLDTWGRAGGDIVTSPDEIVASIDTSLANPRELSMERRGIAENLFYNPGRATDVAVEWLNQNVFMAEDEGY